MQLFSNRIARRVFGLALMLFFALPFGLSVAGCAKKVTTQYCNGGDSGPVIGQLTSIQLSPTLATTGESLNYGQIGNTLSVSGLDCKGSTVSVTSATYGTSDMSFADINPSNGQVCGGTWNRNTGGGIPDYTTCTAPTSVLNSDGSMKYRAFVTATSNGVTSNAIPVYVHAIATGLAFGQSAQRSCSGTDISKFVDPDTTCCPADSTTVVSAPVYNGTSCVSQNKTAQVAVRVYANNSTTAANNITCQAGKVTLAAQGTGGIVSFDQNGVATALQPGSATITATLANSANAFNSGFFSTCPPANITLTPVGASGTSLSVPVNNTQPFTASITDTNGVSITGLALTYQSTTPQTIPAAQGGSVTPTFPGTANITAICEPPTCNPAPTNQLGYFGNGKPITSNALTITAGGTSSTAVYVSSTNSQYIFPIDFSTGTQGNLVKLPYIPNSMVITVDGSTIYMGGVNPTTGGQGALMTFSTATNQVTATNTLVPGRVLSVSPSGNIVVVTDADRGTVSLVSGGSSVTTSYGAVATQAQWTPDSATLFVTTTTNQLLVYNAQSNWQPVTLAGADTLYRDVTVMVPAVGAYFAGTPNIEGRSYCATTTIATAGTPPVTANAFAPLSDSKAAVTERVAATNDGLHILGASSTTGVSDLYFTATPNGACTTATAAVTFSSTTGNRAFAGVAPAAITGVQPATNSKIAFVTFTGTGNGRVPFYLPSTTSATGTLNYLQLSTTNGTPTAPVAGTWATDNNTFYLGTAGDNIVHLITLTYPATGNPVPADSSQLIPNLPALSGTGTATPNLIVQRPRRVQS